MEKPPGDEEPEAQIFLSKEEASYLRQRERKRLAGLESQEETEAIKTSASQQEALNMGL